MSTRRSIWSSSTKLAVSLLLLALAIYLLARFQVAITPVILAVILAYVLSPLVNFVQMTMKVSRGLATLQVYLLFLVLIIVIPLVVIPPLASQVRALNVDVQRILQQIESVMSSQVSIGGRVVLDVGAYVEDLAGAFEAVIEPFFGRTLGFAVEVISSLVWVIFILVVSFYLIKDGPVLREWFEKLMPLEFRGDFIRLRNEITPVWAAFFRGQLLLALVVAIIFTVIGVVLGLPFALAMGGLAGLLEFLPSIGHGIWLVIAAILAFSLGSTWLPLPNWIFMSIIIGLHLVFQQFDLNYLIPRIIGRRVHLPPLVVILGIVAGAALAGVLGIALAAPTIATGRILGRYVFANLFDQDPFPESAETKVVTPSMDWWRLRRRSTEKPGLRVESD